VDRSVIAFRLGHESPDTQSCFEADLALKKKALLRPAPFNPRPGTISAPDPPLKFLKNL
jgi:hypothetical protein